MNNVVVFEDKIKQILEKLLHTTCHSNFTNKFDNLLSELDTDESSLISLPVFTEWINHAVAMWCFQKKTPPDHVASFALNVTSLLSKNEETFCSLNNNNFYVKLINILGVRKPEAASAKKRAYIKLLSSFLEHKSGCEWTSACSFWEDVLQLGLMDQDEIVMEESQKLTSKILERTIEHDEPFCNKVINRVVQTIRENIDKSKDSNDTAAQDLKPILLLVGNLLEHSMDGALGAQNSFRVLLMFLKHFYLEKITPEFALIAQNKHLVFEIGRIILVVQLLELYISRANGRLSEADVISAIKQIMNNYIVNVPKGRFKDFIKFCNFGLLYSKMIIKISSFTTATNNEIARFFGLLEVLTLMANYCLLLQQYPRLESTVTEDVFRDNYCQQIFTISSEELIRLFYFWRDCLIALPNLFELNRKCLNEIKKYRKYFSRETAVFLVRDMICTTKDTVLVLEKLPELLNNDSKKFNEFFSLQFETLIILMGEFEITWKDGFETIDLLTATFEFLSLSTWSSEAVVPALNVINTCISKYMTANLALLVDRTADSTIDLLGSLLFEKLRDSCALVRKAALEVVSTMSRLSKTEFPSFQKVLIDSKLPTLVFEILASDKEEFVKAAAIRCLQEMILIETIFNNVLKIDLVFEKIVELLLKESQEPVRIEASSFLTFAYDNNLFWDDILENLYEIMVYSSTVDRFWKVRARSLSFWDKVIKKQLQNQGMIDEAFPEVTFSVEDKKIVSLTETEIRKRLTKVLEHLSSTGCLGVLVTAFQDDSDKDVGLTALDIIQNLAKLFQKYKLYRPCCLRDTLSSTDAASLLKKIVTPKEFLKFTQKDLIKINAQKTNAPKVSEKLENIVNDMWKNFGDKA